MSLTFEGLHAGFVVFEKRQNGSDGVAGSLTAEGDVGIHGDGDSGQRLLSALLALVVAVVAQIDERSHSTGGHHRATMIFVAGDGLVHARAVFLDL